MIALPGREGIGSRSPVVPDNSGQSGDGRPQALSSIGQDMRIDGDRVALEVYQTDKGMRARAIFDTVEGKKDTVDMGSLFYIEAPDGCELGLPTRWELVHYSRGFLINR